ncbi:hypothetical protein [Candidatus Poriferisodalis sp.]|uniref:hypothetical protein n=1 Tax=Candidatus Poriferisodalis sp. TaxID=3101277 RepID=UPI003B5B23A8
MDESVGMVSVVAVLVLGIWLVDYSGDASRAATAVRAASIEAAHYAASAVASPPSKITDADLDRHATEIAERVVGGAAVGTCDTEDQRFEVSAGIHRLTPATGPAAVTVDVTCPLAVSPLFRDTVSARVAIPVPPAPRLRP